MKILNKIENLVKKIQGEKEQKQQQQQSKILSPKSELEFDELVSLTFSINQQGQLFIDGKWANNSIQMASVFAEFVFLLFNGSLYKNLFEYLAAISTINEKYFEFAQNVSLLLQEKIENDLELSEQPIIKPSQAFNLNTNNQKQQNPPILLDNDDDDGLEIADED